MSDRIRIRGHAHWKGCYNDPWHHRCAVDRIEELEAENERLRGAVRVLIPLVPRPTDTTTGLPSQQQQRQRVCDVLDRIEAILEESETSA